MQIELCSLLNVLVEYNVKFSLTVIEILFAFRDSIMFRRNLFGWMVSVNSKIKWSINASLWYFKHIYASVFKCIFLTMYLT